MNISRINSKEEYLSSVKMNISRINHLGNEEEYPLPVRVNISRINCLKKVGIIAIGYWIEYWKENIRHRLR